MAKKQSRIPELGRPDITEVEFRRTTHKVATVEPLDVDGVRTMTVGTALWGVAVLALLPFWGNLQETGRAWWLWAAIAGLGLGLMGIEFCKRRRDVLATLPGEAESARTAPQDETELAPDARADVFGPETDAPSVGRRRKS